MSAVDASSCRPWHVGRISHTSLQPNGGAPVAPSAIRANGKTFVNNAFTEVSEPRALELSEISRDHRQLQARCGERDRGGLRRCRSSRRQWLPARPIARDGTNKRTDAYGGSIENRRQADARSLEGGSSPNRHRAHRHPHLAGGRRPTIPPTAIRSRCSTTSSIQLNALKLVYIHVIEGATGGPRDIAPFDYGSLRKRFKGAISPITATTSNWQRKCSPPDAADLIAFGKPYIANPDLVERLKKGAPLNEPDKATFYGGGTKGYTDYPTLDAALDPAK